MTFAVFASGYGSNLQAIINAVKSKKIKAKLALVIADRADAYALRRAKKAKVPAVFIDPKLYADREAFDRHAVGLLRKANVDVVVLAGFMRILSGYFIKEYRNKILNIHPSLLPAFKGAHAIKDAFDYGVKVTGVTVHIVDEQMDNGPIILQEPLPVRSKDTLAQLTAKIHRLEHKVYPHTIDLFIRGKCTISGRKVIVG